jgi:hypothetical protein
MSTIKDMKMLREKVLQVLDDLEDGKVDISYASTVSKLSETIISGLKSEMQYAILTNSEPSIPFYGEINTKRLDKKGMKKLL